MHLCQWWAEKDELTKSSESEQEEYQKNVEPNWWREYQE